MLNFETAVENSKSNQDDWKKAETFGRSQAQSHERFTRLSRRNISIFLQCTPAQGKLYGSWEVLNFSSSSAPLAKAVFINFNQDN